MPLMHFLNDITPLHTVMSRAVTLRTFFARMRLFLLTLDAIDILCSVYSSF